jgi:hypothetical protein
MWNELFSIYQSVQKDESKELRPIDGSAHSTHKPTSTQTMYIFAYLDDGNGKTLRDVPVKDRLSYLEARQAHLEQRILDLEARVEEITDDLEDD